MHLPVQVLATTSLVLFLNGCSKPASESAAPPNPAASKAEKPPVGRTALDEYVAKPDTNYAYRVVSAMNVGGGTVHALELTSQSWLTTNEVDRTLWKHALTIVEPGEVTSSKALLFITGGANDGKPRNPDGNLARIAQSTKSIVVELRMVPNQPLKFKGDTEGRYEDSLIAYTWDKYLRTLDPKWPARLPMTKSAVRAMDTVQDYLGKKKAKPLAIDGFVVAGASKRGWTTWTTAAVDKRVVAIIPVVIDVLNVDPSMRHHFGAYGFWAPAIGDYSAMNLMDWTGTPEFTKLMEIEDPYSYRDRLTMPKFIMAASGDQFFLPDSSQFYFDALPGVKYLRYFPNADHGLKETDAYDSLLACYDAVLNQRPLPKFSWSVEADGSMKVTAQDAPTVVKLWRATNPEARDFRLETLGRKWESEDLAGSGTYLAKVTKPAKGWTAYFVELTFPSGGPVPHKFTTQVKVVPDTLPFKFEPKDRPR